MSKAISPNNREGLTAENEVTLQNEYLYSSNHALNVNVTGGGSVGIFTLPYDMIQASYPDSVTEVYQSYLGGVLQETVTVTYTDATKEFIDTVVRT